VYKLRTDTCLYATFCIFACDEIFLNLKMYNMKKLFTIVFGLMLGVSLIAQQVNRDMVVVEGGTGFW
jgi:hypothetical protein